MTKPRVSRAAVPLVALMMIIGVAGPSQAAAKKTTSHASIVSTQTVKVGSIALVTGTISPAVSSLPVTLQRLVGHKWTNLSTAKVSHGLFSFKVRASKKASTLHLRVVRHGTTKVKSVITRSQTIHIVKTAYTIFASAVAPGVGSPIVVTGSIRPKAKGSVALQLLHGKTWKTVRTAKLTVASTFTLSLTEPQGSYALRVIKAFSTSVAAGTGHLLRVAVARLPVVTSTALAKGVLGQPYTSTLAATSAVAPYTWSLGASTLPTGLTLSATGVISGKPLKSGTTTVTVIATDAAGHSSASTPLSLTVAAPSLVGWGRADGLQFGPNHDDVSAAPVLVSGLTSVKATASGRDSKLALKTDGTVWAWGNNAYGELGNGTMTSSPVPVQVTGLTSVTAISMGAGNLGITGYALKSDGTVWAWGFGGDGLLGDGSVLSTLVPVQVSNLTGVTAIAAGGLVAYALKSDHTVWAWGANSVGELGNGSSISSSVPVQVSGITTATAIAAGNINGYALRADGTVLAWGDNTMGQLGNGTTTQATTPTPVSNLTGITALAAGDKYALALSGGLVWQMGRTLGQSTSATYVTPTTVNLLASVGAIGAGDNAAYAIQTNGSVVCWGSNSDYDLATTTVDSSAPVTTIPGLSGSLGAGVGKVSAGTGSVALVNADQTVSTWGNNGSGELGNGDAPFVATATAVPFEPADTLGVAVSIDGGYAVTGAGTVWAWGYNSYDRLGSSTLDSSATPVQVPGLSSMTAVVANDDTGYAIRSDGSLWSWGANFGGQLGASSSADANAVPAQVPNLSHVVQVVTRFDGAFALQADGTVWAWGTAQDGVLGTGSSAITRAPVQVPGLTSITAIAAGASDGYALRSDGTVWAWGDNSSHQLGDGTIVSRSTPAQVPGLTGAVSMAAEADAVLVLKSDSTVVGFGYNGNGELGTGNTGNVTTPTVLPALAGATAVGAGQDNGYALKADGTVLAWGDATYANNGNGAGASSMTPTLVPGLTGVISLSPGAASVLALKVP